MLQDLLPRRRSIKLAKVGLEFPSHDLKGGTLADSVRSYESENLCRPRRRQSMQLEAVRAVSVSRFACQIFRKVDDRNGLEWALLDTNTAAYAKIFGNKCNLARGLDRNAHLAHGHDRTGALTLLPALLRFTLQINEMMHSRRGCV